MLAAVHDPYLTQKFFDSEATLESSKGRYMFSTDPTSGQRVMWLGCPNCGVISPLALRPVVTEHATQSWDFSGSETAPTLQPSVNHAGCWHGNLTDGVFKAVGES